MPGIFGGIYKGNESGRTVNLLCNSAVDLVDTKTISSENSLYKANAIFGLFPMESSQELVSIAPDNKAVLCGRLFRKTSGEPVTISSLDIDSIKRSSGRELADHYWGRYILIIFDDQDVTFYRDPQGLSVLYYRKIEQGYLFATNIAALIDCVQKDISFNWTYLVSFVASNHNLTTVTPFEDIYEILPGCATTLFMNDFQKVGLTQFWNPTSIKPSYIYDEEYFQQKIYDTTLMTLSSWVSGAKKINIELSGGLDSSSLLALLKHSGHKGPIQALNYYNSFLASSDEKEYAQDVCDLYQVPVNYYDSRERLPFSQTKLPQRYDRPSSALIDTTTAQFIISSLNVGKDDEILSGQGGDHLFLAPPPREALVDFILDRGLLQSAPVFKSICAYYRMPYLSLLQSSLRAYWLHKRGNLSQLSLVNAPQNWMMDDFNQMVNPAIFKPFFWEDLKNVHPGKAQQILALLSATLYIDRGHYITGKSVINPLLSQPLVELALSMPTYQSFKGGYNRYQYRNAMAKHLQGKFLWRTSKGETSGEIVAGVRKNFDLLRPIILEGEFAQRRYIDPSKLHHVLLEVKSGKTNNLWPIMNLFVAEKWIDSWKSKS